MVYFVVFLECRRYIAVKEEWLANLLIGKEAKMFFSADKEAVANFELNTEYYLNREREACYNVFVLKSFDSEDEAQIYASSKRVTAQIEYKTGTKFGKKYVRNEPVAYIALSDEENDATLNMQHECEALFESPARRAALDTHEITPIFVNEGHAQPIACQEFQSPDLENAYKSILESSAQKNQTCGEILILEQELQVLNLNDVNGKQPLDIQNADDTYSSAGDNIVFLLNDDRNESKNSCEVSLPNTSLDSEELAPTNSYKCLSQGLTCQESLACGIDQNRTDSSLEVSDYNSSPQMAKTFGQTSKNHASCAVNQIQVKCEYLQGKNDNLERALKKMNERLGVEVISDSESDGLSDTCDINVDPNINTLHFQRDTFFATKYFYITDTSGNRYYLDHLVKLKLNLIKQLKKMNENYPTSSVDYDFVFLSLLLRGVFGRTELKECGSSKYIKNLNRSKLKFTKDVFRERINQDKKRLEHFRAAIIRIGDTLLEEEI